jgi:hypothetical protein
MSLSMHSASVPIFVRRLSDMLVWLDEAGAHAKAKKFDPNNGLGLRLTPDMLPFSRQIQIASDSVPAGPGRTLTFTGEAFLKHFSFPNFSFHCTMTCTLLRQGGVELGMMDHLGAP